MRHAHPRVPAPILFAFLVLRDAIARFQRHRCTTAAAAIAFHVLFSLFPLVLIVAALVGSDIRDESVRNQIADGLMAALPLDETAKAQIDRLLDQATRNLAAIGLIGVVALIWSASGMLGSVRGAMELAWEGRLGTRPFVRGKLVDAVFLTVVVAVILSSFLAGILVSVLPRISADVFAGTPFEAYSDAIRSSVAPAVSVVGTWVILVMAYKFLPTPRPALRYAMLGALPAALLFEGARILFAVYVTDIATYDIVYGSIGSIIAFLAFVYVGSIITLFGAELGAAIRRVHSTWRLLATRPGRPSAG